MSETRACKECGERKGAADFPLKMTSGASPNGGLRYRMETCLACANAAAPKAGKGDVPACPICKRMERDGHDSWCTPERRANAEADRLAIEAPTPMVVRRGQPSYVEPATPPKTSLWTDYEKRNKRRKEEAAVAVATQAGTKRCLRCRVDKPVDDFANIGRHGAKMPNCRPCHSEVMKEARGKRRPPEAAAAEAPQRDDTPIVIPGMETHVTTSNGANATTLPELRAERERLLAHLADMDQRIADAEALEAYADVPPEALASELAETERRLTLLRRAAELRGAA